MNEAFMYFGVFGVVFNIIGRSVRLAARCYRRPLTSNSYGNVLRAKRAAGQPTIQPLVGLLPFVLLAAQHAAWLLFAPAADGRGILHSSLFLPFAGAWGLQFAHAVGRLILAHVTRAPFPMFDTVTLVSALGAADAALPALLGVYVLPLDPLVRVLTRRDRPALVQTTPARTAVCVWAALAVSTFAYARFVLLVIGDITEHLGIACLTVRKKDAAGNWRAADEVEREKKQ
jgi:ethanolaminephosphotransferase